MFWCSYQNIISNFYDKKVIVNCAIFSQGNRLFKEGKFELAKAKYEKACFFSILCFYQHYLLLVLAVLNNL